MHNFWPTITLWALSIALSSCNVEQMLTDEKLVNYAAYLIPQVGKDQEFNITEDTVLTMQANPALPTAQMDETTFQWWQQRLRYQVVTAPRHGSLGPCFDDSNWCEYHPAANFSGEDQWEYQITDGPIVSSERGVITIKVTPVNDAPVPGTAQVIMASNQREITFELNAAVDPDNAPEDLEYHLIGSIDTDGTLAGCLDGSSNRQCTYRLPNNRDQIQFDLDYRIFDGESWSTATGKVTIQITKEIAGCTDPEAHNYLPGATVEDNSCLFLGCTDPTANNYWPKANQNDQSCLYHGCIDPQADNFDPTANKDDGSCLYSCQSNSRYEEIIDYRVEYSQQKINVVFAIDTSGSMSNEITNVKQNIDYFASTVRSSLPQSKIVMMGTHLVDNYILPAPYPQDGFYNGIYWHYRYLGSYNKMRSVAEAFETNKTYSLPYAEMFFKDQSERVMELPEYPLFIRNSFTHFIFITDDTEETYDTQINQQRLTSFQTKMNGILGPNESDYTIHAIHTQENYDQNCNLASGLNYHLPYPQASASTGGLSLNICQKDWKALFEQIKNRVIASSAAINLKECLYHSKQLEKLQVSCGTKNLQLASTDYQFIDASSWRPAHIIIDPNFLSAQGCDLTAPIQITVNYKLP